MPTPDLEAVRQRAIAAARQRTGQPIAPPPDRCSWPQPQRAPGAAAAAGRASPVVRGDEEYAILGANVVVELYSESRARQPTTRAWAIIRRADRSQRLAGQRTSRPDRRHADRTDRTDRTSRSDQPEERGMVADVR